MDEMIPNGTISVERSVSMSVEVDVISSEDESCGLILISDGE